MPEKRFSLTCSRCFQPLGTGTIKFIEQSITRYWEIDLFSTLLTLLINHHSSAKPGECNHAHVFRGQMCVGYMQVVRKTRGDQPTLQGGEIEGHHLVTDPDVLFALSSRD